MKKSKKKKLRSTNVDENFLPPHICSAFEASLDTLIADLAARDHSSSVRASTLTFKDAYLEREFKSKYLDPSLVSADVRRAAAIQKWMTVEERNEATNQRIMFSHGDDLGWVEVDKIFDHAQHLATQVLGPLRMESLLTRGYHTNGASTRVRRSVIAALQKHGGEAHVTQSCLPYWMFYYARGNVLSEQPLKVVESSAMFTVDKSSDIDRVACKEPEINMFIQRTAGDHIRKRLRVFGIDLNDQTINQQLAKVAYERKLATIDLSSASDSISVELVRRILPREWFDFLDDIRVKSTSIDGDIHNLSMFSSMGNGFTFELESLLFFCLVRSVAYFTPGSRGRISIFGDDIICPSKIAPRLARFFHYLGFKVNEKKSNWSGPFRESCGKHYHYGVDVTPFYLKARIRCKTDIVRVLNQLLNWSSEAEDSSPGVPHFTDQLAADFHLRWRSVLPKSIWGGYDLSATNSLVTGDRPNKRLLQRNQTVPHDEYHRLLYWLTLRRIMDDPLSSDPRKDGRYFIDDQPPWLNFATWNPYFYMEPQCDIVT